MVTMTATMMARLLVIMFLSSCGHDHEIHAGTVVSKGNVEVRVAAVVGSGNVALTAVLSTAKP